MADNVVDVNAITASLQSLFGQVNGQQLPAVPTSRIDPLLTSATDRNNEMYGATPQIRGLGGEVGSYAPQIMQQGRNISNAYNGPGGAVAAQNQQADINAQEQQARHNMFADLSHALFGQNGEVQLNLGETARHEALAANQANMELAQLSSINPLEDPMGWIMAQIKLPFAQSAAQAHAYARDQALMTIGLENDDLKKAGENFSNIATEHFEQKAAAQKALNAAQGIVAASDAMMKASKESADVKAQSAGIIAKAAEIAGMSATNANNIARVTLDEHQAMQSHVMMQLSQFKDLTTIKDRGTLENLLNTSSQAFGVDMPIAVFESMEAGNKSEFLRYLSGAGTLEERAGMLRRFASAGYIANNPQIQRATDQFEAAYSTARNNYAAAQAQGKEAKDVPFQSLPEPDRDMWLQATMAQRLNEAANHQYYSLVGASAKQAAQDRGFDLSQTALYQQLEYNRNRHVGPGYMPTADNLLQAAVESMQYQRSQGVFGSVVNHFREVMLQTKGLDLAKMDEGQIAPLWRNYIQAALLDPKNQDNQYVRSAIERQVEALGVYADNMVAAGAVQNGLGTLKYDSYRVPLEARFQGVNSGQGLDIRDRSATTNALVSALVGRGLGTSIFGQSTDWNDAERGLAAAETRGDNHAGYDFRGTPAVQSSGFVERAFQSGVNRGQGMQIPNMPNMPDIPPSPNGFRDRNVDGRQFNRR